MRENVAPRQVTRSRWSYNLKHIAEKHLGFYVSNAHIKGALLEAGYEPVWEDEWDNGINMWFRCGPKPHSKWAADPHGVKARRYKPNRHAKRRLGSWEGLTNRKRGELLSGLILEGG